MTTTNELESVDPELAAIARVISALKGFDVSAQKRILDYAAQKYNIRFENSDHRRNQEEEEPSPPETQGKREPHYSEEAADLPDGLDGISPVAKKWITRSGFNTSNMESLFSLGLDDIDLVAKKIPGKSKKDRMHSVILLKAIASYLSTGVARVTYDQAKEACLHYDAFDNTNFATYLKGMASEIGGAKETGYTLTPRGLTSATEMIRKLISPPAETK